MTGVLNLNDLFYFTQIVERGGLAQAGRALGVPKSTLSKRLLALESATGARLIQRSSRSFVLTDVGHDLYRHAAAMVLQAEAAENVIKGRLAEPSGIVRVTASVPTSQLQLADLLPRVARAHPKIRIVLHATDRFVDVVGEGFDIAVRAHRRPLRDSDLVQRRIGFWPNWLVAAPDYLQRAGVPAHPRDLDASEAIVISPTEAHWTLENGTSTPVTVAPTPRYFADESVALLRAAAAGLGIACLPAPFCQPSIEAGELLRVLPGWTAGGVVITLLIPHRRGQLPAVKVVADAVVDALSIAPHAIDPLPTAR